MQVQFILIQNLHSLYKANFIDDENTCYSIF